MPATARWRFVVARDCASCAISRARAVAVEGRAVVRRVVVVGVVRRVERRRVRCWRSVETSEVGKYAIVAKGAGRVYFESALRLVLGLRLLLQGYLAPL